MFLSAQRANTILETSVQYSAALKMPSFCHRHVSRLVLPIATSPQPITFHNSFVCHLARSFTTTIAMGFNVHRNVANITMGNSVSHRVQAQTHC